jgi:hypothetical protein
MNMENFNQFYVMNRFVLTSIATLYLFFIIGCSSNKQQFKSNYQFDTTVSLPDYSNLNYWAAHPSKKDPSDSLSFTLKKNYQPDTLFDVFFIHPTTYTDLLMPLGWNAPINNIDLNIKTDYSTILFQASIFNEAGNVFSPRYRQANLGAYYPKSKEDTLTALSAFELAYSDIKAAFQYYLANYNNGKPIIIAAHSQGSTHGKRLIKEFFDSTQLQNKLVVAYLVGMPIPANYFKNITPCITPDQTGCICSWRTFKNGYEPDYLQYEHYPAIVTNPLTWDSKIPAASRDINKGGILLKFNKIVKRVANANVNGNVLWSNKPHFFGNILYNTKNYHIGDYNLFYLNVRENVGLRAKRFLQVKGL